MPPAATTTDLATGDLDVTGVYPGTYTLVMRNRVGAVDANFPVIGDVTIPEGPEPGGGTLEITAVMGPVGGSITGTVTAVACSVRPVPLPAVGDDPTDPMAPAVIRRTYDMSQLASVGVDNEATEDDLIPRPLNEHPIEPATPESSSFTYTFSGLPHGDHQLTFGGAPGYTPRPRRRRLLSPVTRTGTTSSTRRTRSRSSCASSMAPTTSQHATVTLTAVPDSGQCPPPTDPNETATGYEFAGVQPDLVAYALQVEVDGYTVSPSAPTSVIVLPRPAAARR